VVPAAPLSPGHAPSSNGLEQPMEGRRCCQPTAGPGWRGGAVDDDGHFEEVVMLGGLGFARARSPVPPE
jgi:hypothetical protein